MTQLEILKYALIGVNACIVREEEVNNQTISRLGRENRISKHRLEKLRKQFSVLGDLIYYEETGKTRNSVK